MNLLIQKLKTWCWVMVFFPYYRIRYALSWRIRKKLNIMDSVETLHYILKHRCSVSRMGDGEFQMITHRIQNGSKNNFGIDTFQDYDISLADQLCKVFKHPANNHLLCIPYAFKRCVGYSGYSRMFCEREFLYRWPQLQRLEPTRTLYGDTQFSRFYLSRKDIKDYHAYVDKLKEIWTGRDLWIIEGCKSRLGVGNDLFDGAREIHRIICPATNAYAKYDEIVSAIKQHIPLNKDTLILLALGHTATVLAYDLAQEGFQAIDIGHVDVEYEWMLMGATKKVPIPGKYVNEVQAGRIVQNCEDKTYLSQIVCSIQ